MSLQMLQKSYLTIVRLLEGKRREEIDKGLLSQIKRLLCRCVDRGDLAEALEKLGASDVRVLVEVLLLAGDQIASDKVSLDAQHIFTEHLSSTLPQLQIELANLTNQALSGELRDSAENLQRQVKLMQELLKASQERDIFALMQALIKSFPGSHSFRNSVLMHLQKLGPAVVLALLYSLHREDGSKLEKLPEILTEMGIVAVPTLVIALHYNDEKIRYMAAEALKKMNAAPAIAALVKSLRDPSWKVRRIAVEALGELEATNAVASIIETLQDKRDPVRLEAVRALGKIRTSQALTALLSMLKDSNWAIRREAVDAMAKYGPSACGYIAKALENDNLVVKKIASRILAEIGTEEAVPALMRAIYDKDISVRERAVIALGRIQGEDSIVPLMFAFDDKAPLVRFAAIQVLINVGSRATVHLLNKALKDPEPLIRKRANMAIQTILNRE